MQFDHRNATGDLGVAMVRAVVLEQLGWIVREQPFRDMGVDANVEQVVDGKANGRLIALQIKSGPPWFKERVRGGIVYQGDLKHWVYWQQHSLPVLVALFDPASRNAYWQARSLALH